jgi:Putative RNA methylase family UPF0020
MCGSGTLLIEAALLRLHVAPGLYRKRFAFQGWHDYSAAQFAVLVSAASAAQRDDGSIGMSLIGNDVSEAAIRIAERDFARTRISLTLLSCTSEMYGTFRTSARPRRSWCVIRPGVCACVVKRRPGDILATFCGSLPGTAVRFCSVVRLV